MQTLQVLNTYEFTSSDHKQYRYWAPSQLYASGDQLARLLQEGWALGRVVEVETVWFGEARYINVYRVKLFRDGQQVTMRVLGNPFIRSLLYDPGLGLELVPYERGRSIRFEVVNK
ncbi:MAG: hypothetical protein Kow0077_24480 [Anaerolineae bacterium]